MEWAQLENNHGSEPVVYPRMNGKLSKYKNKSWVYMRYLVNFPIVLNVYTEFLGVHWCLVG